VLTHLQSLLTGQSEIEGGAFAHFALRPDFTAVAVDDPLYRGQTDAGAGKLVHPVQTLEGAEEYAGVSHVKADAVIADKEDLFTVYCSAANFNPGVYFFGAKLLSIANQGFHHYL